MAEPDVEPNRGSSGSIKIEDSSGLSSDEIRKIAHKSDKDNLQSTSEKFVPSTDQYDWIELTSGEWLKGEFKGMYKKRLEFDSDKLDLLTFDFEDVKQIRTHRIVTVTIFLPDAKGEGLFGFRNRTLEITGILRLNGNKKTFFMVLTKGGTIFFRCRLKIIFIGFMCNFSYLITA